MFFILSKILAFILTPLVWVFGLLIYSLFTKIESRAKKLRITVIIILFISTNPFIVDELFRAYEPVTPDYDLMKTHYDGAIILGGIGSIDLRLSKINFTNGGDRLFQALRLYKLGRVDKFIFTGGSGSIEFPEHKEGTYVHKYLSEIQVPDSAIIIENNSKNTYENAIFTKRIIDSLGLHSKFLLITSAFHMPRALAAFKKAGYTNITPYITNRVSGMRRHSFDHLFIPNADAMLGFQLLIHEWVGFMVYKIKGYA
jgi:uncharacterized SAM-binding protein YcdF (DUF218 family)